MQRTFLEAIESENGFAFGWFHPSCWFDEEGGSILMASGGPEPLVRSRAIIVPRIWIVTTPCRDNTEA